MPKSHLGGISMKDPRVRSYAGSAEAIAARGVIDATEASGEGAKEARHNLGSQGVSSGAFSNESTAPLKLPGSRNSPRDWAKKNRSFRGSE